MNAMNELQHHGILGMKWGIRRYQPYPKGSHAGREVGEAAKKASHMVRSYVQKTASQLKERSAARKAAKEAERKRKILQDPTQLYEHRHEFTVDEINQAINRYGAERRLKDIMQQESARDIENGRKTVEAWLNNAKTGLQVYNLYQNFRHHPEKAILIDTDGSIIKDLMKQKKKNGNSADNQGGDSKRKKNQQQTEQNKSESESKENKPSEDESHKKSPIDKINPGTLKTDTPSKKEEKKAEKEKKSESDKYVDYGKIHTGDLLNELSRDDKEKKKSRRK